MDADTYTLIKSGLRRLFNINLDNYKDEQMKRRLDSWLVRRQMTSWVDYLKFIDQHPDEGLRLRDYLTINVTEFFRDIERWKTLRTQILPMLLNSQTRKSPHQGLRIWSAGCSTGVEPYSLAILLDEVAPMLPHYILATDIDRGALQKAINRGPYVSEEMRNLTPEQVKKYFTTATGNFVKPEVAQRITFKEGDLFSSVFETNFDLIVCRNVVIYFTQSSKDILYNHFCNVLRVGGVLFLGGTEIISHPMDFGFRNRDFSFYEKVLI